MADGDFDEACEGYFGDYPYSGEPSLIDRQYSIAIAAAFRDWGLATQQARTHCLCTPRTSTQQSISLNL